MKNAPMREIGSVFRRARARGRLGQSGAPCVGSTSSTGSSRSGRSFSTTCSRVTPSDRPVDRNLDSVAAVDERVAHDEGTAALDPEHEVADFFPGNASTPTGSRSPALTRTLLLEALEIAAQPRDVVAPPAAARTPARRGAPPGSGVALVPWARQDDRRLRSAASSSISLGTASGSISSSRSPSSIA